MIQGGNFGNNQGFNNNQGNFGNNQGFNNNQGNFCNQGFNNYQVNFNPVQKNNQGNQRIMRVKTHNSFANTNLSKPSAQTILDQIKNEFKAPASDNNILFEFNQNII